MSLLVFVTIFIAKMPPKELCFFYYPRPEGRAVLKDFEDNTVELIE